MAKIDSSSELQEAILVLESKQKEDLKRLKKEFEDVKERLKPKNLIKSGISNLRHSPKLRTGLIIAGAAIVSIFVIKKISSRKRRKQHEKKMGHYSPQPQQSQAKKVSGSIVRYILAALLSQNANKIKSLLNRLFTSVKSSPPKHTEPYTEASNTTQKSNPAY